jgi:hypothetical protein
VAQTGLGNAPFLGALFNEVKPSAVEHLLWNATTSDWQQVLTEFIAVVQPFTVSSSPKHREEYHIETTIL